MKRRGVAVSSFAKGAGLLAFALVALTLAMTAAPSQAAAKAPVPGYSILYSFCQQTNCADGAQPDSAVTVTSAGAIFGTTCDGGTKHDGVLFSLTKTGAETVRADFSNANGGCPNSATLLEKNANEFYGTTSLKGSGDCGTVFALTHAAGQNWTYKLLYSFAATDDGCGPYGGLVMDKKGNLYGTTFFGGNGDSEDGFGTVFELSPPKKANGTWTETILYEFCPANDDCPDGYEPVGNMVMDKTGTLYGVAVAGGAYDNGAIFAIPPYGGEAVLHSFCQLDNCSDGSDPSDNLAMDAAGNLFGTTEFGGTIDDGGTVFELTKQGSFRTLYSFCANPECTDGDLPVSSVILDKAGNLYGATYGGGANDDCGTVFEILHNAGEAVLYSFCDDDTDNDGYGPDSPVTMDAHGNIYGTTSRGGTADEGTVFKLTP